MPILAKEPNLYPLDLLERQQPTLGASDHWWALYALARHEKQLMRKLHAQGVAYYAPLAPKRNRSPSGRVRTSHVLLFPGYVFLRGDDAERRQALASNCVSRCLEVPDGERLFADLQRIHRLIETGAPLTPEARLSAGDRVRVRSGPFANMEGVVIRRHNECRLLVAVDFLQQGASVRLDDCQLEPLD